MIYAILILGGCMKKKICIFILVVLIIIGGFLGYNYLSNKNLITITLDINPSIELKVNKDNIVKKVKALNDDAKDIVYNDLRGKDIDESLNIIVDNLVEKGYANDRYMVVLAYVDEGLDAHEFEKKIQHAFRDIEVTVVMVERITEEDEKLAKEYNITPAKAAYINSILEENEGIEIDNLVNRNVKELKDTHETGYYCDPEYTFDGARCEKEIRREQAKYGDTCELGWFYYDGKCYEEGHMQETGEYSCGPEETLEGTKCVGVEEKEAIGNFTCEKGTLIARGWAKYKKYRDAGDPKQYVCEDKSNAKEPTLRCLTNPGHIMINGKCANGPAPLINGGCPGNDKAINGGCYSIDDEDQWVCPDGAIYEKSKDSFEPLCPDTFKYTIAKGSYTCEEGYVLKGYKCTKPTYKDAEPVWKCEKGYTQVKEGPCLKLSVSKDKEKGYYCEGNDVRLENNQCIYFEIAEAKHI